MAEVVAEKGYVRTSVADVIRMAGVSRATFYAQFTDKEDCFRASFEAIAALMAVVLENELAAIRSATGTQEPIDLLDRLLGTYLTLLHDSPAFAKTFLIEVYAAGPRTIEQRRVSMERFVDLIAETHRGSHGLLGTEPEQRFAAQALVGAVASMVTNMVGAGNTEALPALHEPMMRLVRQLVGTDSARTR